MSGKIFVWLLTTLLLGTVYAQAQQPAKVPRIGFLASGSRSSFASQTEAFRQGMRELGYVEGQNIGLEYRYTEGKTDRFTDHANELVRLKVDVIVTSSSFPPSLTICSRNALFSGES